MAMYRDSAMQQNSAMYRDSDSEHVIYSDRSTMYSPDDQPRRDKCIQCLKGFLHGLNSVFFILACFMTASAIYILVEATFVDDVTGMNLLSVACWLIIWSGGVTIFLTFAGCCGASKQSICLLMVYSIILGTMLVIMITAAILAIVMKGQMSQALIEEMSNIIKYDYGVNLDVTYNRIVTEAWDKGQQYMYCCAVEESNWGLFRQSEWYANQPGIETVSKAYVPLSCCKTDLYGNVLDQHMCQTFTLGPPGLQSGMNNPAVYYTGCYYAAEIWVDFYAAWLIGFGLGIGLFMLSGVLIAVFLMIRIQKKGKRYH